MKLNKIIAILLAVLATVFAMAGCGANTAGESGLPASVQAADPAEPQNKETDQASQSSVQRDDTIKVGLIIATNGLGDKSINDQSYAGLQRAGSELGVETKLMEPEDAAQFYEMNRELSESGYTVIINDTFDMADAVAQAADEYKEVQFVIMDTVVDKENVLSVIYAADQGSFLAGAAAALKSKTETIGFVGGMDNTTIRKFLTGYEQGAKYVNPDINILAEYIGNDMTVWSDTAKGKSLAEELAESGADVVYHAAGGSGLGVIEGCKEKNIWAIGVNTDQEDVAPETVLTSMLTNGEAAVMEAVNSFKQNGTAGGILAMDLENEGVGLVMSSHLSDDEKARLEEIRKGIIEGIIVLADAAS